MTDSPAQHPGPPSVTVADAMQPPSRVREWFLQRAGYIMLNMAANLW